MRYVLSPAAQNDLMEIATYIALGNPVRAQTFVDEIEAHCRKLLKTPYIGHGEEDIRPNLRRIPHSNYMIYYAVEPDVLVIRRILHGARDIEKILEEEW